MKLSQLAAAQNVTVEEFLASHIPGLQPKPNAASMEETLSAFEAWASSFADTAPLLSNEAISRASIYPD